MLIDEYTQESISKHLENIYFPSHKQIKNLIIIDIWGTTIYEDKGIKINNDIVNFIKKNKETSLIFMLTYDRDESRANKNISMIHDQLKDIPKFIIFKRQKGLVIKLLYDILIKKGYSFENTIFIDDNLKNHFNVMDYEINVIKWYYVKYSKHKGHHKEIEKYDLNIDNKDNKYYWKYIKCKYDYLKLKRKLSH